MKDALSTIDVQTSATTKMKKDVVTQAGKFVTDVAILGYCSTAEFRDEIKDMVNKAMDNNSQLMPQEVEAKGRHILLHKGL